jgi:hypothetical protein
MSEAELTPEAKDAIRAYMLKLVIPSAAILTIISGALGYVASGLARLEATSAATADAYAAAEKAVDAAAGAKDANQRAADAVKIAEASAEILDKAKRQTDQLLTGQYDAFSQSLFATKGFRDALGKIGDQQAKDLTAKIDAVAGAWRGGILASGIVRAGQLVIGSDGVSLDSGAGKITFQNPKSLRFVPMTSAVSPNGVYLTETCYVRSIGPDYFILWQGPLDTGGRNHPPSDCTFTVVGVNG